jgi:hypothetical protein
MMACICLSGNEANWRRLTSIQEKSNPSQGRYFKSCLPGRAEKTVSMKVWQDPYAFLLMSAEPNQQSQLLYA